MSSSPPLAPASVRAAALAVLLLLAPAAAQPQPRNRHGEIRPRGQPKSGGQPGRRSGIERSGLGAEDLQTVNDIYVQCMEGGGGQSYVHSNADQGPAKYWYGEAPPGVNGELSMAFDDQGNLIGSATINHKVYMIYNDECTEMNIEDIPPEGVDDSDAADSEARMLIKSAIRGGHLDSSAESRADEEDGRRLSTSYIDIIIPYTKRAMCGKKFNDPYYGMECEDTTENRAPIELYANTAVNNANTYLANSGINGKRFRLLETYLEESNYDEWDKGWSNILNHLQSSSDGYLNGVHAKRDALGADLVYLIISCSFGSQPGGGNYCGYAKMGPVTASNSFGVTCWYFCAVERMSFAHEIGHNMGCKHDRVTDSCSSCEGSNFGWGSSTLGVHTVMGTYLACPNNGCNDRIGHFSNLNVQYNGQLPGSSSENCAATIEDNWPSISSIRTYVAPTVSPMPTAAPTTSAPTPAPTLSLVGAPCSEPQNCASGLCSGGKPTNRKCLSNGEPETGPTPPTPSPVASPVAPSPTPSPIASPVTCGSRNDRCSGSRPPCCAGLRCKNNGRCG